jgi:hypothetical protein
MIGGGENMEEEKKVEGFGVERVYQTQEKKLGGEKMEEIDFVRQIAKEEKLEPIDVRVRGDPDYMEEYETGIMDILDFIWVYGQSTGGFLLQVEDGVPEFIVIECGYTPNEFSRYHYSRSETLVTDGKTVFISRLVDSDGNTHHDEYYKFMLVNATFVMTVRYEENNFNGENRYLHVFYYGDKNSKLVNVLRRLNDLLSP